ncbi:MAG: CdaR family protein [Acidobacteriota bacterium]
MSADGRRRGGRPGSRTGWIPVAVAMVLALLYWAFTVSEEQSTRDFVVVPQFVNLPENLTVAEEGSPRALTVTVKGAPEMVRRLREGDVEVKVDVGHMKAGPQVVEVGEESVRLPSSVELVRVVPPAVHFVLDQRVTASLPLKPVFVGQPAAGRQVLGWKVDPPAVKVSGPSALLAKMKGVPTQPVSVEGRSQDFQVPVVPVPSDPQMVVAEPGPMGLTVFLGEKREERTVGPVFVRVAGGGTALEVDPAAVKVVVEGPQSLVSSLAPGDFRAEVTAPALRSPGAEVQIRPAVTTSDPSLADKVSITGVIPRYVTLRVSREGRARREEVVTP